MKSSNHKNHVRKVIMILCTAFVSCSFALAQPKPDASVGFTVREASDRLGALMASTEQAMKYVAPVDVYDDIREVWERLELLAEKTEGAIRYSVPDKLQVIEPVYYASDNPSEYSHTFTIPNVFINFNLPTLH